MTQQIAQVSVRILDKEYQVACPAEERTDLLDSAEILNSKMREIRDSGRIVGLDRIAVMAALNMANDLLHAIVLSAGLNSPTCNSRIRHDIGIGASCGVRYRPGLLSTLNHYLGVVHCRQHLSRAVETVSLLRPRLTPPVAPVRERRLGNGTGGKRLLSSK